MRGEKVLFGRKIVLTASPSHTHTFIFTLRPINARARRGEM